MSTTAPDDLQQQHPLRSLEEEAVLGLYRTSQLLLDLNEAFCRERGFTLAQYNVLRILRGAGDAGLGRNEIRERLIHRMPDVTRLLDKMEEAGLVRRERSATDRRYVPTVLTERGQALVNELDGPVVKLQRSHLGHLSPGQLHTLIETLAVIRSRLESE
ncbi:MarR family winged helix-turn-helix transcriptional regulator [Deinococcus marmoris]|uniref:Transcriptional regulator, MarR family n=1 Tax=Deinococcus marmoris TaxID=249408 RepID=A0A1U7NY51_9DEIO|nr:MarR family transcriptional regulator [Deinococcus marmoris]OLV17851.1 Transcriptional regulator, MarR family [Deinococcus marmoris]